MEKHLILLDLDGTLLRSDGTIDDYTKQVLGKLTSLGHDVIIVTGRADYRSRNYYEELGLKTLFVNRNSGHIHYPKEVNFKELVTYIDDKAIRKLIEDKKYLECDKVYLENINKVFVIKGDHDFYKRYKDCELNFELNNDYIDKLTLVTVHVKNFLLENINNYLDSFDSIRYEQFSFVNDTTIINIYPKVVDKVNSLSILSDYYQVPNERIIAIGDGMNDIELLRNAGIGVAMQNADIIVKTNARYITKNTNEECGVGLFLKDYFNL